MYVCDSDNCRVWQNIAQVIKSHNAAQCENKFKYLKSKYLKKKDNMSNRSSGSATVHFEYFNEFEDIFKQDLIVEPTIASSSRPNPIAFELSREMPITQEQQLNTGRPKKNIKLKNALIDLNKVLRESEQNKEKRHQELISLQKEVLQSYNNIMEKLLEKI
ncbi:hypothetical protein ACJJTC_019373 [Scirpophaga incertulas]